MTLKKQKPHKPKKQDINNNSFVTQISFTYYKMVSNINLKFKMIDGYFENKPENKFQAGLMQRNNTTVNWMRIPG